MPLTLTRSLLAVILPGFVAIASWVMLLVLEMPGFAEVYRQYPMPLNAFAIGCAILVGSILETIMSYLEEYWDRAREKNFDVNRDWYDYLALELDKVAPVGFEYISRKVTEMFFELTMALAAPSFLFGVAVVLHRHAPGADARWTVASLIGAILSAGLFLAAARHSHKELCRTRSQLVQRLKRNAFTGPRVAPIESAA
jgi:hypothetical protein